MDRPHEAKGMGWGRFAAMIALSAGIGFALAYQLVYEADHVLFSLNRLIASLVMACAMTVVMLGFMWPMYKGTVAKIAVLALATVAGLTLLTVNRTQALINDVSFMQAMIPHHSIAINNARKAPIRDPRVRKLADGIIHNQVLEITEMQLLIDDIRRNGPRGQFVLQASPAVVTPDMAPAIREAVQ